MYEEEDDELPLQYRRMTAQLNSNASDFNRRLASWIAMKQVMSDQLSKYQGQQSFSTTNFFQDMQTMQHQNMQKLQAAAPPAMQNFWQPVFPRSFQAPMQPPNTMHHNGMYRQSPYPTPSSQGYHHQVQPSRPSSVSAPHHSPPLSNGQANPLSPTEAPQSQEQPGSSAPNEVLAPSPKADRPHNPPPPPSKHIPGPQRSDSSSSLPVESPTNLVPHVPEPSSTSMSPFIGSELQGKSQDCLGQQQSMFPTPDNMPPPTSQPSLYPLSTGLPLEAQMFFQRGCDSTLSPAPQPAMSDMPVSQPSYHYNPNQLRSRTTHPSYDGMSQTLAPGALETNLESQNWSASETASIDSASTSYFNGFTNTPFEEKLGGDDRFTLDNISPGSLINDNYTPNDQDYDTYFDSSCYGQQAEL